MKHRTIAEYNRKRNFDRTAEPRGAARTSGRGTRSFVVQKHHASHLHYDFRLELDGVLKSWAVPKGPCLDPDVKRLAMHVEDHPIDYGQFEGTIPAGEYGGGTVMVWDRGSWVPDDQSPEKAYRRGMLKFSLEGEKLKGRWMLVRFGEKSGSKETWLLRKESDSFAAKLSRSDILVELPLSVATGRTLEEIAENRRVKKSSRGKAVKPARKKSSEPARTRGAAAAVRLPEVAFQLATLVESPPTGEGWVHEIKLDGYRIQCRSAHGVVRLITRGGKDYTEKFPKIAEELAKLPMTSAVLDGEIVLEEESGRTSFQLLQNALSEGDTDRAVYYLFDAPYLDGRDMRKLALVDRKKALRELVRGKRLRRIRYSEHFDNDGTAVLSKAASLGLEGIICKRADAPYSERRGKTWLKVKCTKGQEFVIGGYTKSTNAAFAFGALLVGYHDGNRLVYAGKVGSGFTHASRRALGVALKKLEVSDSPFDGDLTRAERSGARWVHPKLVGQIEFTEWTSDGRLRHPSFQGLREDKKAAEVTREGPSSATRPPARRQAASRGRGGETVAIHGVRLSHADRPITPGSRLTKEALAAFYDRFEDIILPHFVDRPIVLVRCPGGGAGKCFYQKHATEGFPKVIPRVAIREEKGMQEYLHVGKLEHIIELVQLNTVEFHAWGSCAHSVERPDRMVFDLDPGPGIAWKDVVKAAKSLRAFLEEHELTSFAKTTGGKGIHVVVPIARRYSWDEVKSVCKAASNSFAARHPGMFTTTMSLKKRGGKIFLDYLRNGRGATSIVPFSPRARPDAPFALPVSWDELSKDGAGHTLDTVTRRLRSLKIDPWDRIHQLRQPISKLSKATS